MKSEARSTKACRSFPRKDLVALSAPVLQPEPAARHPLHTAYHVTFCCSTILIANYAFANRAIAAEDPLDFEDTVSKCLGQAMKRVAPSTVVISGREFRRSGVSRPRPSGGAAHG